jgi:sugar phosphate isomerase/epimerase
MPGSAIAAQLYTLREHLKTPGEIAASLKKVGQLGYEAVQVSGLGPIEPARLKEAADQAGVRLIATHTGFERIRGEPQAVIEEHRLWGCRHVAIGGLPAEYRSEAGYHRFAREASAAARPLVEAGLTFSYHNHSFELERFGSRTALEILYDESDPAVFSAELDTYWIQHGGGNPASWLRYLKGRCHLVHLKDMAMKGSQQLFAEVGEGNLEWPALLAACREAGVEWHIVEQDTCQRDPFESLGISLRNLRKMGVE